ncbi:MAG: response regulator transcription factor [Clostridioides sp.]|jgi:DNA-binding response OmpR family regulator|nr:response regulator transcription factor [Clostridioides sp.]
MYKILIIEDNQVIREELKFMLEKNGYSVDTTDDFSDVASFAIKSNPHLILLDLNLPVYDGYYVCREIRKKSTVPIIVVTSRDSEIDELMSLNLGADFFVKKPYNIQILLAKISSLLARVYDVNNTRLLSYGGISLDVGKSIAYYGDENIELTKNELRILEILIENQGEIVPRDEIMNALWQSDLFIDDNTLTVNITRLRKKLSEIGCEDIIKTRRGLGYSLL